MMIKSLLKILTIILTISSCSPSDVEMSNLINELSWNSITLEHTGAGDYVKFNDSIVKELIKIGKPASSLLVSSISDSSKTVIIHMILTKILEPENCDITLSQKYIYKNCNDLIGWHSIYNGLIWEWTEKENTTIEQDEILKIRMYWERRIFEKTDRWKINIDSIFNLLEKEDDLKYPCEKD